jgi:prevent-host-death family protein
MKEIAISEFKAKCLGILDQVSKTKKPVRVTRFGEPVVEVFPVAVPKRKGTWLGCMAGTVQIKGDIVAPATDEDEWEVLSE